MGRSRVKAFENGVDLQYYKPAADFAPLKVTERGQGPLLVFTGQMDYRPNVEAVESFARRSFPQFRNRHANARFAIVGRNPAPAVPALAPLPGVVVAGAVPDGRGAREGVVSEKGGSVRCNIGRRRVIKIKQTDIEK